MRSLIVLLVLASLAFSTAPGWVTVGVALNYSAGSDTISFTVQERTGENVKTSIKVSSAQNPYTANENASGSSGQFWFDKDQLASGNPQDFLVMGQGKQTFAGKEWNTITLQGTVSGAQTTRVYDKDSGLMLKQTVSAPGAPEVILTQYKVPNWVAIAPPSPPSAPPPSGTPPSTPPPSGTPPSTPPSAPPSAPPSSPPGAPPSIPPSPPPSGGDFWPEEEPPKESPCCLSGLVLAMVGFAAFRPALQSAGRKKK